MECRGSPWVWCAAAALLCTTWTPEQLINLRELNYTLWLTNQCHSSWAKGDAACSLHDSTQRHCNTGNCSLCLLLQIKTSTWTAEPKVLMALWEFDLKGFLHLTAESLKTNSFFSRTVSNFLRVTTIWGCILKEPHFRHKKCYPFDTSPLSLIRICHRLVKVQHWFLSHAGMQQIKPKLFYVHTDA